MQAFLQKLTKKLEGLNIKERMSSSYWYWLSTSSSPDKFVRAYDRRLFYYYNKFHNETKSVETDEAPNQDWANVMQILLFCIKYDDT